MLSNASKVLRNLKVSSLLLAAIYALNQRVYADYFEGCDHTFYIGIGSSYLQSPYYPKFYPPYTSCRYRFIAPLDHNIIVNCTINLDKAPNGCSTEYFYLARDGDKDLRDSEQLCGYGTVIRKTLFRSVTMAYISEGSYGLFTCHLIVQRQPCDCGWSVNTKIVNGQETSVNEFPSMVALKVVNSMQNLYCAAAIISHRHLITAAHCAEAQPNPAYIEAHVGRHNLESPTDTKYFAIYYISEIVPHPNYVADPVQNDIAILITSTNIEYSRGVGPICLPPPTNAQNDFAYNDVDVIGWGTTKLAGPLSPTLQKIKLMVTDADTCSTIFANDTTVSPTQICTYDYSGTGKDSCQFDSGGPVIFRYNRQFLIGIISFGIGCGDGGFTAGINTRVTSYMKWIYEVTAYSTCTVNM